MRKALVVCSLALVACSGVGGGTTTVTIGEGASDPVGAIEELPKPACSGGTLLRRARWRFPVRPDWPRLPKERPHRQWQPRWRTATGRWRPISGTALPRVSGKRLSGRWWSRTWAPPARKGGILRGRSDSRKGAQRLMVTATSMVRGSTSSPRSAPGWRRADGAGGAVARVVQRGFAPDTARSGRGPPLLVAANDESLSPDASQRILQLVELITRVG